MRKNEVTGKVVLYTEEGAKVVDAEVRHWFNVHGEGYNFKFAEPEKYLLVGGARTIPTDNIHAAKCRPEAIGQAVNLTRTKFFRFMLDLQRLAQFEPIHKYNHCFEGETFRQDDCDTDIDFKQSVAELDKQFYKKYGLNPAQIKFIEERYNYDDV